MTDLPPIPKKNEAVKASDIARIIRRVQEITPVPSPDITPKLSSAGTQFALARPYRRSEPQHPFQLVPALSIPGYKEQDDGKDHLRYYVRYGLINGVRVKGTLEIDGSITPDDDEDYGPSTLIEVPEDATNFVVYIKGQCFFFGWCGPQDPPPWWENGTCYRGPIPFVDDDNELAVPEIGFGDQGAEGGDDEEWELYPCQPDPIPGPPCEGDGGYNWSGDGWIKDNAHGYKVPAWNRQPFRYPLARITGDGEGQFSQPVYNWLDYLTVDFAYTGVNTLGQEADGTNTVAFVYGPMFNASLYLEEQPEKTLLCEFPCPLSGLGPDWPPGKGGGGWTPEEILAEIDRIYGHWLYRVYQIGDTNDIGMQDGHLWVGKNDDPIVVSWGGDTLTGDETEEAPYVVALKVVFADIANPEATPLFTPTIVGSVGQNITPDTNSYTITPDNWPYGYTVSALNNGEVFLPVAYVWFDDNGKMVIKEAHRGNASVLVDMIGGDDGVTGDDGFALPAHHISIVAGRVQQPINTLLADICFSTVESLADAQIYVSDESVAPEVIYRLQKKKVTKYLYMGAVAYTKTDDDWSDSGADILGWNCEQPPEE